MVGNLKGALWAVVLMMGIIPAASSQAQDIRVLGQFQDWTAHAFKEGTRTTCYMTTSPTSYVPTDRNRHGDVLLFVTHFPGEDVKSEVSVVVGYNWSPGSEVRAQIGSRSYDLFTQDRNAWMLDDSLQPRFIADMRAGADMRVSGTSRRGTQTRYTFSLRGFTRSQEAINSACGVS